MSSFAGALHIFVEDAQDSSWGKVYIDNIRFTDDAGNEVARDELGGSTSAPTMTPGRRSRARRRRSVRTVDRDRGYLLQVLHRPTNALAAAAVCAAPRPPRDDRERAECVRVRADRRR